MKGGNKMGIIYCYTNLVNNKKYIGQTINPKKRFNQHKSSAFNEKDSEYNSPLHRAFRKYGYENFKYEVLIENNEIDILNELEIYFIKKYNSQIPNGYNIEPGGKNCSKPKTQEHKEKLTWGQAELTLEEIISLREAYARKESPKEIYNKFYKNRLHYNSFLNIWSGRRYKNIMPEIIENGRHTKLNLDIARQIRKEREETNLSYDKLAIKYNVSKSAIADIIKGRTWKETVTEPVSTILGTEE